MSEQLKFPKSVDEVLRLYGDDPRRRDVVLTFAVFAELAQRIEAIEAVLRDA